ncbi:ubiquitin carboxyl-terminal hydrolase 24, partial [Brachionus plicatilis]
MKKLSLKLWPDDVSNFNELHLKIVLSMLKNSNFNSKMNSLKEICKLIDNSKTFLANSAPIDEDFLGTWLVNEQILSFAIEGNLDQAQYCDKLKSIVEFLGNRISHDEIKTLWQMQFNKPSSIVDNLYSLISIVTSKFNQEQLDDLIGFIKSTWNDPSFKSHDRLVYLLRLIGQESKNSKTHLKILDALWSLKDQSASTHPFLIQLIYKEHLSVLNTDRVYRDQAKSVYIKKCLGLIDQENKLGALYALKHLFDILNSYKTKSWPSVKSLRDVLGEIVVPEIKTLCQNLINYNQFRAQFANTIFSHEQIIDLHLNLLKFALKEGNLYLRLVRAEEIWDSLTESNDELNVQKCFEWFIECIVDLNEQTRNEMFRQRVTKLDPTKLTLKGYECYRLFFLYHNQSESRVQITSSDSSDFLVEESDLDLDYLWKLILNNESDQIVHNSVEFLLKLCCSNLAPSLKRDVHTFNTKLTQTIFEKLKQNESKETQLNNLLKCLEEFIRIFDTKEEAFCLTSHSSSIKIDKISVKVQLNENKECFEVKNLYSNDLLESLRQKIAELVNNSVNNFQLLHESKILAQSLDNKTLSFLEINDASLLTCKLIPSTPVKSSEFFTTLSICSTPKSSLFSNRLSISCP